MGHQAIAGTRFGLWQLSFGDPWLLAPENDRSPHALLVSAHFSGVNGSGLPRGWNRSRRCHIRLDAVPLLPGLRPSRTAVATLLVGLLLAIPGAAAAPLPPSTAWTSGETLRYVLKWTGLPVGEAVLIATRSQSADGRDLWYFAVTARTNSVIDKIYPVRDRVDACADFDLKRSFGFHQVQREGSYHRDLEVQFDQVNHRVTRRRSGGQPKTIEIDRDAYDPLTAFFALRQKRLEPHMSLTAPITDGKKCVIAAVHVLARQRIRIEAGTFDALLVQPELEHVGGVIRKTPGAEIKLWITDDDRHIPLKVESEVVVGHFSAELIALPPPSPGPGEAHPRPQPQGPTSTGLPGDPVECFNIFKAAGAESSAH